VAPIGLQIKKSYLERWIFMRITRAQLARMIDYIPSYEKGYVTREDVVRACNEGKDHRYGVVYILSNCYIPLAAKILEGTGSRVGAGVLHHFRAFEEHSTEVKMCMTRDAVEKGATEVDMLMNIGAFKAGEYELTSADMESVVNAAKSMGEVTVKIILETGFLSDEEIVQACLLAKKAGADFVKSGTGIGPSGATVHHVRLMKRTVGDSMGVKAAGGIRTTRDAIAMIDAGADRIGSSHAKAIVEGID
jgi:deoxyribose-phosphate aldolase